MKSSTAHLILILAAILWSSGGVFIKLVDMHPVAITGARSLVAAIVFLIYIRRPKFNRDKETIIGALAYCGMVMLYVASMKLTTAANAIFLEFTAPIYVVIFGYYMLNERVTKFDIFAMAIIFFGMGLFFMDELSFYGFWGNIMALGAGVCLALVTVIVRKQKESSAFEIVLLGNLVTALICTPFIVKAIPHTQISDWLILALLGVFQLGIPYVLYTLVLKHLPAIDAILIGMIEPVLNPIWVFLFVGETIGPWTFVGGAMVLSGSLGRSYFKYRKRK
ncbi:MAG: EamA family transporter [Candidatus Marinimicrobia bacterium]|nr:EamA family transporter [Candidatus Neomarinimicrobiota bacterium]MBT3675269.1 EamA family transporter [Candidatus Neomarinimicrobiota bacterium]MBT3763344.1 EamA family transporter [Candidatus Neomarinimicrobiota bacterium]MBT4067686.1 EamA family transporter [Candidatus Neomarinimicrobiota bacterium]MBT4269885.1 EamA family transporter [Candidatus Neomarinimicrobiota bacterium]